MKLVRYAIVPALAAMLFGFVPSASADSVGLALGPGGVYFDYHAGYAHRGDYGHERHYRRYDRDDRYHRYHRDDRYHRYHRYEHSYRVYPSYRHGERYGYYGYYEYWSRPPVHRFYGREYHHRGDWDDRWHH